MMSQAYIIATCIFLSLNISLFSQDRFIKNPILPGFNPDPDIIRVEDDYYIATTTFEWYPSVSIYHSKDLVHWRLISRALTEKHLSLEGVPNSGGNYIPSLSFNPQDSLFYLVYSNVLGRDWPLMSMEAFVVTSKDICGPWSDPIYLNSAGFDPAFFFDPNGKAYLINMVLDYRNDLQMPGFLLQEYDWRKKELIGVAKMIFHLENYDPKYRYIFPEGPHIYYREGYYYLLFAAGGTYWDHQSWMARSKNIWGPYLPAPNNPILTSKGIEKGGLQKAGQGGLVSTPSGEWYLAHHASRPILPDSVSPLGRETCLQKVEWTEQGWLQLAGGGMYPQKRVPAPSLHTYSFEAVQLNDGFDQQVLPLHFQSLRSPMDESWISMDQKKGYLSIRGRQPITSLIRQSLVARRWTSLSFEAETSIEFHPKHFLQMAGLTLFYDTQDFQYAYISFDEKKGRVLRLLQRNSQNGWNKFNEYEQAIAEEGPLRLKVKVQNGESQFYYAASSDNWIAFGPRISIAHLSDEGVKGNKNGFTGAFVGISVQDRLYEKIWAHIDYLNYSPN